MRLIPSFRRIPFRRKHSHQDLPAASMLLAEWRVTLVDPSRPRRASIPQPAGPTGSSTPFVSFPPVARTERGASTNVTVQADSSTSLLQHNPS